MRRFVRNAVVLTCLLVVSGCAGTLKYTKAIDRFAEATKQAEEAVRRLSEPKAGERERLLAYALVNPGSISAGAGGCSTGSRDCELWVTDGDEQERRLSAGLAAPETLKLLADISGYAADLKTIALANREQEINVALGSVTNGVGAIAQVFDRKVSSQAGIGNQVIAFLVSGQLNKLKLDALREATKKGEAALPEQKKFLKTMQSLLTSREIGAAQVRFRKAQNAFKLGQGNGTRTVESLMEFERAANELDALLKLKANLEGNGPSVFKSMRTAHKKLYEALLSDNPQSFDAALAEIDFFLREAKRFAGIVGQLK